MKKLNTPWLGRGDDAERPFAVERRKLAPRPAKPVPEPNPPKTTTRSRKPIEGAPTLWRGRWADHHQTGDEDGEA